MSNTGSNTPVVSSAPAAPAATGQVSGSSPTGNATGYTGGTTANNMTELKEKAPQVYNAMMMAYAQTITSDMQHRQDNLKKIMREAEQEAQS